jgi:cytoskeleton protein RodZ
LPSPLPTRLQVGSSLEEARQRRGLSIEEAADLTKIRPKYLRALETEDWETLPSTAYAKGFLRTYARALGLDADPFVDEYRRRVESGLEAERLLPFGDPVLEGRRRLPGLEEPRRRLGPFLAGLVVALIAFALVLLIAGGLGDSSRHHRRTPAHHATQPHRHQGAPMPSGPVSLRLHVMSGAQVCLVSAGQALIDSQSLSPGAKAGPFHGRRFRLDLASFGGGALRLRINGKTHRIVARGRASYEIRGARVSRTHYRGPRCP